MRLHIDLIKGSFILLLAFGLSNFLHFLYQLSMARMLTLGEYGILAPLSAIIYIFLIFSESVQTIITKYSNKENDKGKLKNLIKRSFRKAFSISLVFFVIYLIASVPLSFYLDINYFLVSFTGLMIFVTLLAPITRGIMQGKERFVGLGLNMIIESGGKLFLGIFFVYLGFKVFGAIAGIISAGIISIVISLIPLKDIIRSKENKVETIGIYNYAKPTFLITFIIIVFYSLDVIIAKIFFPAEIAGSYAIASILGKIIFWGTLPISKAMFPMSAEEENRKERSEDIFLNSLIMLLLGTTLALIVFYLFPEFIINIFSGKVVPEAQKVLFFVGIAFGLTSIANLILLYKLSLGKVKGCSYLFIFIIIEIVLLCIFSANLFQFSIAFITAAAVLLWGSIVLMNN